MYVLLCGYCVVFVWLLCGYCVAAATSDGTANKQNVKAISAPRNISRLECHGLLHLGKRGEEVARAKAQLARPSEGDKRTSYSAPPQSCQAMARKRNQKRDRDMKRRCELLYRAQNGLFDESEEIWH